MKEADVQLAVLKKVRDGNPDANELVVLDFKNSFLGGMLFTVGFTQESKKWTNRVYVESGNYHLFRNDELLLSTLGSRSRKSAVELLLSPETSSGLIAFVIVATIACLVYRSPETPKIPDILSQALTLILGFYFGSSKSKTDN